MAFVTVACFFALVSLAYLVIPDFLDYTAASYAETIVSAEDNDTGYCPGERAFYTITLNRERQGIIKIVEQWCRSEGLCSISTTTERSAIVARPEEPTVRRSHRIVPDLHTMRGGQFWEMQHGNYTVGHEHDVEIYSVFIYLREDCPEWVGRSKLGPENIGPPS